MIILLRTGHEHSGSELNTVVEADKRRRLGRGRSFPVLTVLLHLLFLQSLLLLPSSLLRLTNFAIQLQSPPNSSFNPSILRSIFTVRNHNITSAYV